MDSSEFPEYYPALPFTLIIDDPLEDSEQRDLGHEFVLHFNAEEETYYVYLFKDVEMAKALKRSYDLANTRGKVSKVVAFDPRLIEPHFGVRYFDETGKETIMPMRDYLRNIEFKNEFRTNP